MSRLMIAAILMIAVPAQAQTAAERARAQRRRDVARHNYAQAEAQRLVAQGLGMLTRPADPWNMGYRPYRYGYYRQYPGGPVLSPSYPKGQPFRYRGYNSYGGPVVAPSFNHGPAFRYR